MQNYTSRTIFTTSEYARFNQIENKKLRNKLMSLYDFLLYLSNERGIALNKIQISINEIIEIQEIINKKRKKEGKRAKKVFKRSTLADYLKKLNELCLIKKVDAGKKGSIYEFIRVIKSHLCITKLDKISDKNSDSSNTDEINGSDEICVGALVHYNNINTKILSNTTVKTVDADFDHEQYVENLEKVKSFKEIEYELIEALKLMKVRKGKLKDTVIENIKNNYYRISQKYAFKYICSVIRNAKAMLQIERDRYVLELKNARNEVRKGTKKEKGNFNNFKQREYTSEQYQEILEASREAWRLEIV